RNTVAGAYVRHDISERWTQRFQVGAMDKSYSDIDAADGLLGYQPAPYDDFRFPAFTGPVYDRGDPVPIEDTDVDIAAFYEDRNRQFDYNLVYQGDRAGLLVGA